MGVDVVHSVPIPGARACPEHRPVADSLLLILRGRELRDGERRDAAAVNRIDVLGEAYRRAVDRDDSAPRPREMPVRTNRARRMLAPRARWLVREIQAQNRIRGFRPGVGEEPPRVAMEQDRRVCETCGPRAACPRASIRTETLRRDTDALRRRASPPGSCSERLPTRIRADTTGGTTRPGRCVRSATRARLGLRRDRPHRCA